MVRTSQSGKQLILVFLESQQPQNLSPSKSQNLSRGVRRQSLVFEIAQHIQPRQFVVAHDPDRHPKHLPSCARAVSFQTGRGVTFSSVRYTGRSSNRHYGK
jgi:hypothetical protein